MVIKKEIEKYIHKQDKIIVAVSGGPDSMLLLNCLNLLKEEYQLQLIIAHVNHQTRKECEEEASYIEEYCLKNNLQFCSMKITSYQKGRFTESEAREKRMAYFAELTQKYQANYVMTAHHSSDEMETILMKIIRGSTLDSIIGIKDITVIDKVKYIRPILKFSKEEILEELKKENIKYYQDESNFSNDHLRNRIRNQVIPILKKEDPKIHLKFQKFSQELSDTFDYINRELIKVENQILQNGETNLQEFRKLDPFLQNEYIKRQLKKLYQNEITKINQTIEANILKFLQRDTSKNIFKLPNDYYIEKKGYTFSLKKPTIKKPYCIECQDLLELPNGNILEKIDHYEEKSNYEIHLNSKDITLPLYITTRRPQMSLPLKNTKGHQKVKDILINLKIPNEEKDQIPIMIDAENKVLWILGLKKSKYDIEKDKNYDIIYKYKERTILNENEKKYKQ